jgi:transcription initiation factor TFIIIB Brf1 subunit/transcription initiation factor TFIIB
MGDRYTWYENCPKCKGKETVEVYDAPSCYMFARVCEKCGWTDEKNYYETEPDVIELMTKEEAKKRGLIWRSGLEAVLSRDNI